MKFNEAVESAEKMKFKPMDWSQPWHDPERTDWDAGKSKVKTIPKKEKDEVGKNVREFGSGVKAVDPTGSKITQQYDSLADDSGKKDPLTWKHYKKYFAPKDKDPELNM